MKRVLVVSNCQKRGNSIGLIGGLLNVLKNLDKTKYHISLFDTNYFEACHNSSDYPVDQYYGLPDSRIKRVIRYIPKLRGKYPIWLTIRTFESILKENAFDIVLIRQVPYYVDKLVKIAHNHGAKVVLEPIGSDVLRVTSRTKQRLKVAFAEADAVVGREQTNVLIAVQETYRVPKEKIKVIRECLRNVKQIKDLVGTLSREEMHEEVGLPYSDYNIVCGYNGSKAQQHGKILDALIEVKDVLSKGYQIVLPMTYGVGDYSNYVNELKSICDSQGLNAVIITDFKTNKQMAFLHLITDLYIEIQPSDNGNAFMIEALFAQNQIVTGRWLNYQRFEQFGVPYHLIDTPEDLPSMLRKFFTGQEKKAVIPQELMNYFDVPDDFDPISFWTELFNI